MESCNLREKKNMGFAQNFVYGMACQLSRTLNCQFYSRFVAEY